MKTIKFLLFSIIFLFPIPQASAITQQIDSSLETTVSSKVQMKRNSKVNHLKHGRNLVSQGHKDGNTEGVLSLVFCIFSLLFFQAANSQMSLIGLLLGTIYAGVAIVFLILSITFLAIFLVKKAKLNEPN